MAQDARCILRHFFSQRGDWSYEAYGANGAYEPLVPLPNWGGPGWGLGLPIPRRLCRLFRQYPGYPEYQDFPV